MNNPRQSQGRGTYLSQWSGVSVGGKQSHYFRATFKDHVLERKTEQGDSGVIGKVGHIDY